MKRKLKLVVSERTFRASERMDFVLRIGEYHYKGVFKGELYDESEENPTHQDLELWDQLNIYVYTKLESMIKRDGVAPKKLELTLSLNVN